MTRINASFILISALASSVFFSSPTFALVNKSAGVPSIASVQLASIAYKNLKPFSANYVTFRSGNDVGSAILELKPIDNNQYELTYQSKVSRFFLSDRRYEKTTFSNKSGSLIPLHYDYKRTGTGPNKALSVKFDQENQKIQIVDGEELTWNGEFDNQLFRVDFPQKLAQGATSTQYDFINYRGEKRKYTLEVIETDNLSLPYGNITAIKVLIGRESSKRVTYAWFAPSLNFNLVRLQQFKNDKEQGDMQLDTFDYL
ncbi:MAG: hypothetical protein ACJAVV_000420 [Alphaproteobacteria bacterium]|jgi:hypothetical protein